MRIALIPSAFAPAVGGVEELTHQLGLRLARDGDQVEVWTNRHPAELPATEQIDGHRVRRFQFELPAARPRQLVAAAAPSARSLVELRRAVREFRPDVLHVQCFSGNGVYATLLAAIGRLPLVVTLQGETVMDDNDIYEHSLSLRTGLRVALKRASAVTACSGFVLRDAEVRFGLKRGRGTIVPNGVEIEHTPQSVALDVPFRRFVFGVGRVVPKKGFDLLLHAFARVAGDRSELGLVIGGRGAARQDLATQAQQLGISERVMLPGTLSRGQVAWAMEHATAFVLPSRVEPFGIVVLEALRAGCPAVVSSRGGAGEIVRHERDGLVADPLDTAQLAAALARVLDDEQLRERLSVAARSRVAEFSWGRIAAQYREIYGGVI